MTQAEQVAFQARLKTQTDSIFSRMAQAIGPDFANYQRESQVSRTRERQS